ncbi:hypothetical protein [Ancylobacter radicis]|uniref:Twin-arginine translocation pathway signal n=1 Tax=Ancylobacter radicis TaxID=2836179 RepID=A0ABS5RAI6_9HYPH|nr:hypothetical protein [Ancylobacter radicis]MBS9478656.1 hypothetical protein [Ancylobacter radicis]
MGTHDREREKCIPSRREALRTIGLGTMAAAVPAGALALAGEPHPDAELIRLGAEFDRLHATWLPLWRRWTEIELATRAMAERLSAGHGEAGWYLYKHYRTASAANGLDASMEAADAVLRQMRDLAEKIHAIPAQGLAGLYVKARVVLHESVPTCEWYGVADNDMDWDVLVFIRFVREMAALAGEARA